jgi:hypothetical protein
MSRLVYMDCKKKTFKNIFSLDLIPQGFPTNILYLLLVTLMFSVVCLMRLSTTKLRCYQMKH